MNFLIGSGCSYPALQALRNIEDEVEQLFKLKKVEEAELKLADFLKPLVNSTQELLKKKHDSDHKQTLSSYQAFLDAISKILFERKSSILHQQATIFTTNYDMFIEKASEASAESMILNDGFNRFPSLQNSYYFSPKTFFNSVFNTGNLYKYRVQIPSINLLKLHGSFNWQIIGGKIIHSLDYIKQAAIFDYTKDAHKVTKFLEMFAIVPPNKDKFKETLLNQIYYDLLRIYANELDKENTLLIAEGFSFADEHIYDLTKRALINPTLRLIIFCFNKDELDGYKNKFSEFNNVDIIYSESADINFDQFNSILLDVLPMIEEVQIK